MSFYPVVNEGDELVDIAADQTVEWFTKNKNEILAVRMTLDRAAQLWEECHQFPKVVSEVKAFDAILRKEGQLWPQCFVREAILTQIVKKSPYLDISQVAFVSGVGSELRVSISVASQLGFKNIKIVHKEGEEPLKLESIERLFFGLKVSFLPSEDLTLEPKDSSLLINSFNSETDSEVLSDIAFLNFLSTGAIVVNLWAKDQESPLRHEAKNLGFNYISGEEIALQTNENFKQAIKSLK